MATSCCFNTLRFRPFIVSGNEATIRLFLAVASFSRGKYRGIDLRNLLITLFDNAFRSKVHKKIYKESGENVNVCRLISLYTSPFSLHSL